MLGVALRPNTRWHVGRGSQALFNSNSHAFGGANNNPQDGLFTAFCSSLLARHGIQALQQQIAHLLI